MTVVLQVEVEGQGELIVQTHLRISVRFGEPKDD